MTSARRLLGSAAATLVAVVGLAVPVALGVVAAPAAQAAACSGSTGVTVVTDFNSLGGGVQGACVAGGGGDAASLLFAAAGFPLTYAQRQPGFVCRVSGVPQSDPCVNTSPADAYWGLWWSDGKDGRWTYSSLGVKALEVPDGGYVALSWDDVGGAAPPSYTPAVRGTSPSPQPSPQPTQQPTQQPGGEPDPQSSSQPSQSGQPDQSAGGSSGQSSSGTDQQSSQPDEGSAAPAPSDGTSRAPSDGASTSGPADRRKGPRGESTAPASPTDTATPGGSSPTAPAGDDVDDLADPVSPVSSEAAVAADGGLPGWVAPLVIVLLFAGAGVVLALKRKHATS